jgi:hypothetical protein
MDLLPTTCMFFCIVNNQSLSFTLIAHTPTKYVNLMWYDFPNFNVMIISIYEHGNILVTTFHGVNMVMFPKL